LSTSALLFVFTVTICLKMISPEVVNFSPPKSLQQTYTLKKEQALNKVPSQDLGSHFHGVRIK
jgi:hypothetical protein